MPTMVAAVPTHAAFLRGINVTGSRMTNETLRAPFSELGLEDVATFRASGNVIFSARDEARLSARIEVALEAALGLKVIVFVRSAEQVRAIAAHQPFARRAVEASKGKLQVLFLARSPTAKVRAEVLGLATDEDRLAFGDSELYWLPSGGTQTAALDLKTIEKRLAPTTMRTMGTVEQIAAKYFTR